MSTSVIFKRGTTFAGTCTYTPDTGGPSTITSVTITSNIILADGVTVPLTITKAGNGLSFVASTSASTGEWALGTARWDIKFVNAGAVFYSDTMRLQVIDQVTG
jgi:hypothetical protein